MNQILKESKEFKILFNKSQNLLNGRYSSKIKGDGIEFVDLKEYIPGDDIRKIDWKVTARENKVFVKEFLEDKDASHFVLLDISASMKNKFKFAKILATSLLLSSHKLSDNLTIGFFNKDEIKIFPLSKNKNQFMRYVYEISKIKAKSQGNLKDLLLKIIKITNRKSIISIITDELEFTNQINTLISIIKQKNKLNYFHLYSSSEKEIEVGLNSFEDVETGIDGIYDLNEDEINEYKKEFDKQLKQIENNLLYLGVKPLMINTQEGLRYQIQNKLEVD